jgi:hypothetical protein
MFAPASGQVPLVHQGYWAKNVKTTSRKIAKCRFREQPPNENENNSG